MNWVLLSMQCKGHNIGYIDSERYIACVCTTITIQTIGTMLVAIVATMHYILLWRLWRLCISVAMLHSRVVFLVQCLNSHLQFLLHGMSVYSTCKFEQYPYHLLTPSILSISHNHNVLTLCPWHKLGHLFQPSSEYLWLDSQPNMWVLHLGLFLMCIDVSWLDTLSVWLSRRTFVFLVQLHTHSAGSFEYFGYVVLHVSMAWYAPFDMAMVVKLW